MPPAELELRLTHDGRCWCVDNLYLSLRADTLTGLDDALADHLHTTGQLRSNPVDVCMRFDRGTLPDWLRQYSYHYFNRRIRLNPRGDRDAKR